MNGTESQAVVVFLLTDLDLTMTFLNVAEASESEATTRRNHVNAVTAYDSVLRLMEKAMPDADHQQELDGKLELLKKRLQASGHKF
jgi:hypothetical protein